MRFERPTIVDHGSIAEHTFTRCETGDPHPFNGTEPPPKDKDIWPLDNFGECSSGHAS